MAVTRKADVASQIPTIWSKRLFAQAENLTFWNRFEGPPGSSMPILRLDDLTKDAGDTVKFDIVLALTGAGLTGDTAGGLLEGNEEALKMRQTSVAVDSLQHAVRSTKLANVLNIHNLRTVALGQLRKWLAGKMDDKIFTELTGGSGATTLPTTSKWFAGTATSIATVDNTDAAGRLKLADITEMKAYMQVVNKIEPIRLENGEEIFGLVLHPYTAMQLKRYDASWAQAQREAQVRGDSNPLFTGALGMWDGVVLYSSNRVPTAADGVASISVARNVFFGAQALSRAYAHYPDWTEEEFSYGQEFGVATWLVYGNKLNVFDLTAGGGAAAADFTAIGSGVLYAAAVAPSA